jgi:putative transposase
MSTRRVRGRTYLLQPSEHTNNIVGYVLAVQAKKWNIRLHAVCVMGNQYHAVQSDPDGNAVNFQRDCNHFIAKGLNAHYGESESVWASQQGSRVHLESAGDLIAKIAYAMANPVEAGLVRDGSSWPGVRVAWPHKPMVFTRPTTYFSAAKNSPWPAQAELELARPPDHDNTSDEDLAKIINKAIYDREQQFRDQRDRTERQFLGRAKVLAQSRHSRPRSRERRGKISPTVACRDKWRRKERLQQNKRWLIAYGDALERWRAGDREVVFPAGTYLMRVVHGARCAEAPG